jgi:cytochrome c oxidase assembly factor CtaG
MAYWMRIVYVLAFVPPNAIAGFAIANASEVLYPHYNTVPRLYGMTALQDQMLGGAIMWVWSSEMMINAALTMLGVISIQDRRRKQRLATQKAQPDTATLPFSPSKVGP